MAEALIYESKQMSLIIIEEKTKYIILSRKNNIHNNLIISDVDFERVKNFKYLGVELSMSGNNHKEILSRINSANKCFFALKIILKTHLGGTPYSGLLFRIPVASHHAR